MTNGDADFVEVCVFNVEREVSAFEVLFKA